MSGPGWSPPSDGEIFVLFGGVCLAMAVAFYPLMLLLSAGLRRLTGSWTRRIVILIGVAAPFVGLHYSFLRARPYSTEAILVGLAIATASFWVAAWRIGPTLLPRPRRASS